MPVLETGAKNANRPVTGQRRGPAKLNADELELFTRNLQLQIEAGVPLLRALELLGSQGSSGAIAAMGTELAERISSGSSLAEALEESPQTFEPIYRNLIHAGEFAGQLDRMLAELGRFLAWRTQLRKTLVQASIYPAIVIVATVGLVLFVLGFVFPKLGGLFSRLGDSLPAHVRALIGAGDFIAGSWPWLLGAMGAILIGAVVALRSRPGRLAMWRIGSMMPVFGPVYRKIDLAVFLRNLAILEAAGVPLVRSLELTRDAISSAEIRDAIDKTSLAVMSGTTLAEALTETEQFPSMLVNIIAVGEESGQLGDVFERLASRYDEEARGSVKRALAIMEPALTLGLGLFVAAIAVTVVSTLYQVIKLAGK